MYPVVIVRHSVMMTSGEDRINALPIVCSENYDKVIRDKFIFTALVCVSTHISFIIFIKKNHGLNYYF